MIETAKYRIAGHLVPALPSGLRSRLVPPENAWSREDLKVVATPKPAPVRLLIARANYAGQGYHWARAAETLPGVTATNLAFVSDTDTIGAPADFAVRKSVGEFSRIWARRQRKSIKRNFTHVLIEAELPILGSLYEGDLIAEIQDLQSAGLRVGLVSHGSDTRLPSLHAQIEKDSPFHKRLDGLTEKLEQTTGKKLQMMDDLRLPEFVPTPELLCFRPDAQWLPLLTSLDPWVDALPTTLENRKPTVLHVPGGQPELKGTDSISPAMHRLADEGLIHYVEASGLSHTEMQELICEADVVVNQVGMGLYATVGVEAMLAGKIVIAQVWDSVRRHIREETGKDLPILEATRDTVYDVVRTIAEHPNDYRTLGAESREFALAAHSYRQAAHALEGFVRS